MFDDDAYEPDSPKHPDYHELMAERADLERKAEKEARLDHEFYVGQRVTINYGPATVVDVKPGLVVVHADIGQAWFRRPEDVQPLIEDKP
jgi:hypothetical protein